MRANETKISAGLWTLWLGKDLTCVHIPRAISHKPVHQQSFSIYVRCVAEVSCTGREELEDEQTQNRTSLSSSSWFNDEERLFRHLFVHYNKRIRPVRNSSDPVNVALTFSLMQIHHLVDTAMCPTRPKHVLHIRTWLMTDTVTISG